MDTIEEFNKARDEALLSLDEERIRTLYRDNFGVELSANPVLFWGDIHKAITGIKSLPIESRRRSKAWLDERGYRSYDDGDLDSGGTT